VLALTRAGFQKWKDRWKTARLSVPVRLERPRREMLRRLEVSPVRATLSKALTFEPVTG